MVVSPRLSVWARILCRVRASFEKRIEELFARFRCQPDRTHAGGPAADEALRSARGDPGHLLRGPTRRSARVTRSKRVGQKHVGQDLTGLLKPTAGHVHLDGADAFSSPATIEAYKAILGYVPEEPHLYSYLTGPEYLQLIGRLRGISDATLEDKIDRFLRCWTSTTIVTRRCRPIRKGCAEGPHCRRRAPQPANRGPGRAVSGLESAPLACSKASCARWRPKERLSCSARTSSKSSSRSARVSSSSRTAASSVTTRSRAFAQRSSCRRSTRYSPRWSLKRTWRSARKDSWRAMKT